MSGGDDGNRRTGCLAGFLTLIGVGVIAVPGGAYVGARIGEAIAPLDLHGENLQIIPPGVVIGGIIGVVVAVVIGVVVMAVTGRRGSATVVCQRCGREMEPGEVCGFCRIRRCPKCGRRAAGNRCRACGTVLKTTQDRL